MTDKYSAPPTFPSPPPRRGRPLPRLRGPVPTLRDQSLHFANRNRRNSLKIKASAPIQSLHPALSSRARRFSADEGPLFRFAPSPLALIPHPSETSPHFLPSAENLITKPRLETAAN